MWSHPIIAHFFSLLMSDPATEEAIHAKFRRALLDLRDVALSLGPDIAVEQDIRDMDSAIYQLDNARFEEDEMAAATRASMEASYNELTAREAEEKRRKEIADKEEQQRKGASNKRPKRAVAEKKRKAVAGRRRQRGDDTPSKDDCVVCHQPIAVRRGCAVFIECGHSQFHADCAKESYASNGRCPLCNLPKGVPISLL